MYKLTQSMPPPDESKKSNRESAYDVPGPYWYMASHYCLLKTDYTACHPEKDYHVYTACGTYHYAYARQTQVNWKRPWYTV